MVGRYQSSDGLSHAFVFSARDGFLPFDYPGAVYTLFAGINNRGKISGIFNDGAGNFHGFIARLRRSP